MYIFAPKRHRKLNNSIFKNAEEFQAQNIFFCISIMMTVHSTTKCKMFFKNTFFKLGVKMEEKMGLFFRVNNFKT